MAYFNTDQLHADLKAKGYASKVVKPWHVKEGDILILPDSSLYNMPTVHIPVEITIIDNYQDFTRPYPYKEAARSHYRFYHKPVNPEDIKYLYNRHSTYGWTRFDDVEIYRKTTKTRP